MKKFAKLGIVLVAFLVACLTASAQNTTQCLVQGVWVPCSMAPQTSFVQAAVSSKSTGSVASINAAYGSNVTKYNTLVVVYANGNNNNAAAPITDTLSLTWFKAAQVANSTTFETEIWFAPVTTGGADTVTVTPGGTNASIAMTIYEVAGLVYPALNSTATGNQALDQTATGTVTSGTSPAITLAPTTPNQYIFAGYGLGTAAQTITVGSPFSNDSGQQNPTTPAGLFSFVSSSYFKPDISTVNPSATATSEPWAVAAATFRTLTVPVQGYVLSEARDTGGAVQPNRADSTGRQFSLPYPDTTTTSYHASKKFAGSSTTDVAVMPGNATNTALVTRILVSCTETTAGIVNLELLKRSAADTSGTSAAMTAVPDDANYAAAVSAPLSYTGTGPSVGSAVGDLDNYQLGCNASATVGPNDIYIFKPAKPIVLRGTAQQIAINFGGAITGGNLTVTFEWMETTTP